MNKGRISSAFGENFRWDKISVLGEILYFGLVDMRNLIWLGYKQHKEWI